MIPSAILDGLWIRENDTLEFRILELSPEGFTFRVAKRYEEELKKSSFSFLLRFFSYREGKQQEIIVDRFIWRQKEENDFWLCLEIEVKENREYEEAARWMSEEYREYVRLFLEEEPEVRAKAMTGYPGEQEASFPSSYKELVQLTANDWKEWKKRNCSFGIMIEAPWQWERYQILSIGEYLRWYELEAKLQSGALESEDISWIYFGNANCFHLLPEIRILTELLKKCVSEGKKAVVQIPPIREGKVPWMEQYILTLAGNWREISAEKLEIILNDWGFLRYVSEFPEFKITMGNYLLKYKKDPRFLWKLGTQDILANGLYGGWTSEEFLSYIKKEYHVTRFCVESTGILQHLPKEEITVFAPWYQMNTSSFCPLYAMGEEGNRGMQRENDSCDHPCKDYQMLYPAFLKMCGRYNGIWGYDLTGIESLIEQGADRVIWNF